MKKVVCMMIVAIIGIGVNMANAQPWRDGQKLQREHRSTSKVDGAARGPHSNSFQGRQDNTISFGFQYGHLRRGGFEGEISYNSVGNRGRKRQYDSNKYRSKESPAGQEFRGDNKSKPICPFCGTKMS